MIRGTATYRPPMFVVVICFGFLAVNAVVIQTVLTEDSPVKQGVRAAVLGLALFALWVHNARVEEWVFATLILSGVLLVTRQNLDQLAVIFTLLLVVLLTLVPHRLVLKVAAVASCASLGLIFALLFAGITRDEMQVTGDAALLRVFREQRTFGVASIPFLFNVVYGACALSVLYALEHLSKRQFLLVLGGALVVSTHLFRQSDGRGGYYSFLLFLVLLVIVPRLRLTWAYAAVPAALFPVSVAVAYFADHQLDRQLSFRPRLYRAFLEETVWTDYLLSRTVKQIGFDVDNSYLHLAVGAGVATLTLFLVLFWRAVVVLMRRGMYTHVAFLVATAVYCFSESLLVRPENLFIVYTWYLVVRYGGGLDREAERQSTDVTAPAPRQAARRANT